MIRFERLLRVDTPDPVFCVVFSPDGTQLGWAGGRPMHLTLLAALLLADASATPVRADTVPALELALLTPERAAALAGAMDGDVGIDGVFFPRLESIWRLTLFVWERG